jgi:tetratricopeptide (TPR) repeat protein
MSVHQSWLNNVWSLQYSHHALNPQTGLSELANPPMEHTRADLWMASDAIRSGDPELAERLIAERAKQGDILAKKLFADALYAQDDISGALEIWQKIGDITTIKNVALQGQQAGNLDEALQAYETAWKMDVESVTLPLANILINYKQDYSRAEFVLKSAMESFPESRYWPIWSSRLGDMLRIQKRWDEAQVAYQDSLALAPDDLAAHIGLGWVYYERDDSLQKALNEFQFVISNPESKGLGQYTIGLVLTREKRYTEADVWLVQALAAYPDNCWFYVARGNAAREGGELALALGVYQDAINLCPDFAQVYHEIAYAYQLNEQSTQAMSASEQAVILNNPPNLYIYLRAGSIYEWGGDKGRALEAYRQTLLLDPSNTTALSGVQRLTLTPSP